jgi:hypothetical protein
LNAEALELDPRYRGRDFLERLPAFAAARAEGGASFAGGV